MIDTLIASLPYLARGAIQTLWLSAATIAGSLAIGSLAGIGSVLFGSAFRLAAVFYVFLVRGIPVLVLIFLIYFLLPSFSIHVSDYLAVLAALITYGGALVTEAVRGSLLSVGVEQTNSGLGLGLRRRQVMAYVVIPQATKAALPALLNIAVHLTKCTSFVSIVGVWELTLAAKEITERTLQPFAILLAVMGFYYAICYPMAIAARRLEARV